MRHRARTPSTLPDRDRDAYTRYVARLAERWSASLISKQPGVLLHGDAHRDNAIVSKDAVVLIDFEDASIGPPLYDLRAPFAVHRLGSCTQAEIDALLVAYGQSAPEGEIELLADLKIAEMCGAYVALCARYPHIVEQTRVRIASLTDRSLYPDWWDKWHEPEH